MNGGQAIYEAVIDALGGASDTFFVTVPQGRRFDGQDYTVVISPVTKLESSNKDNSTMSIETYTIDVIGENYKTTWDTTLIIREYLQGFADSIISCAEFVSCDYLKEPEAELHRYQLTYRIFAKENIPN